MFDKDGTLWVAFVQNAHIYVSHSKNYGIDFSQPIKVNLVGEQFYTNGENRPKIVVNNEKDIFVSWTQKTEGMFTGNIRFSRSLDQGQSFETPRTINDDGLLTSHRFDSLTLTNEGNLYIIWLDKRDKVAAKKTGSTYHGSAVYYSYSEDKGKSFKPNIKIADNSCECCRIASAANDHNTVGIIWRHIFQDSVRDHAFSMIKEDHTHEFFRATFDEWEINACPHHGPSIVSHNNHFYYTWYSNGSRQSGIYFAKIEHGKKQSTQVTLIDQHASASHPFITNIGEKLYIVWKTLENDSTHVNVISSKNSGVHWSKPKVIARSTGRSDHPLIALNNQSAYLYWQTEEEGFTLHEIN